MRHPARPPHSAPRALAGGAAGEERARAPVLEWREAVVVPPGESVHALQPQQLRSPRLWWPLHLGDQARDGRARSGWHHHTWRHPPTDEVVPGLC